jgi:DNA-directed RNA polymerase subunit RPC12/RpoP
MADNKIERQYIYYVCGWCRSKIYYTKDAEPTTPCPECGWNHTDKLRYNDVPSEIKIDLNNPTIT